MLAEDGRLAQDIPAARLPLEFEKLMKMKIMELKKEAKKAKRRRDGNSPDGLSWKKVAKHILS